MSTSESHPMDPGMLELFQAEMDAHIPVLNEGLLALEKGQVDAAQIEAMMRAAHSIKGAARIVGIESAVRVAHVMEDCFTAAKEHRITLRSDSVDVLLRGTDTLQRICSPGEDEPFNNDALPELLEQIAAVREGKVVTAIAAARSLEKASLPVQTSSRELIAATVRAGEPSVTFPAVLDEAAADALRREMLDTLSLQPAQIEVDFAQVSKLPAIAIALLAAFGMELRQINPSGTLTARGISTETRRVLRTAGLLAMFGTN